MNQKPTKQKLYVGGARRVPIVVSYGLSQIDHVNPIFLQRSCRYSRTWAARVVPPMGFCGQRKFSAETWDRVLPKMKELAEKWWLNTGEKLCFAMWGKMSGVERTPRCPTYTEGSETIESLAVELDGSDYEQLRLVSYSWRW